MSNIKKWDGPFILSGIFILYVWNQVLYSYSISSMRKDVMCFAIVLLIRMLYQKKKKKNIMFDVWCRWWWWVLLLGWKNGVVEGDRCCCRWKYNDGNMAEALWWEWYGNVYIRNRLYITLYRIFSIGKVFFSLRYFCHVSNFLYFFFPEFLYIGVTITDVTCNMRLYASQIIRLFTFHK